VLGESFCSVDLNKCEEMLETEKKIKEKSIKEKNEEQKKLSKKMKELKGQLYAKFGNQINLEY
jgi:chaperonin cofactor prefoldin